MEQAYKWRKKLYLFKHADHLLWFGKEAWNNVVVGDLWWKIVFPGFSFGWKCFKTWNMSWLVGAFTFLPIYSPRSSYSNRKLLESFVQVHCSPGSPSSWFGGHSLDIEPVWKITPGTSHMKVAGGGRRFYSQGLSMILGDPTKGAEPSAPSKKHGIAWACMLSPSHSWNLRCLVFVKTCPGRSRACSAWHALQGTIIHCLWAWGEKEHWEWPGHSEILSSVHG